MPATRCPLDAAAVYLCAAGYDSGRFVGITGQSLPILEGSDFAWFDNACSLMPLSASVHKPRATRCKL
jgi:hypothetical protein